MEEALSDYSKELIATIGDEVDRLEVSGGSVCLSVCMCDSLLHVLDACDVSVSAHSCVPVCASETRVCKNKRVSQ